VTGPNPARIGACGECGAYRADGRPPYLHQPSCSRAGDLQLDRFITEMAAGDTAGPPLLTEEGQAAVDAALARLRRQ
jgi:hypothetical protein